MKESCARAFFEARLCCLHSIQGRIASFPSHGAFKGIFRQKLIGPLTHAEAAAVRMRRCRGLLVKKRRGRHSISTTLAVTLLLLQLLHSLP